MDSRAQLRELAQETRHRLAREVWQAREGAPVPWNLFQTPLRAARDPRVEAVLGVYNAVQRLGLQLPMMVGSLHGRSWAGFCMGGRDPG